MFEKHLWKSDILSKDAGHRPENVTLPQVFLKHFAKLYSTYLSIYSLVLCYLQIGFWGSNKFHFVSKFRKVLEIVYFELFCKKLLHTINNEREKSLT